MLGVCIYPYIRSNCIMLYRTTDERRRERRGFYYHYRRLQRQGGWARGQGKGLPELFQEGKEETKDNVLFTHQWPAHQGCGMGGLLQPKSCRANSGGTGHESIRILLLPILKEGAQQPLQFPLLLQHSKGFHADRHDECRVRFQLPHWQRREPDL